MSNAGRGRGYSGRGRAQRPGGDDDAVRTLQELSPRATDSREREKRDLDTEKERDVDTRRDELKRDRDSRHDELKRDRDSRHDELKRDRDIAREEEETSLEGISAEDDAALKELLHIDEQYQPLLVLLEQFSPSEDGIQFNRKLRHFETTITNMCPDENRLHQAFATFRAAALLSPVTARKLAAVGASFTRQQRQQLLRTTLLNVIMQGTYSKLDILERANPMFLINAANLMGDYFAEARLCNGNKVHILSPPLLHYMKALLASDDWRAHKSLATQLMQNGRELHSVLSTELEELSIAIRLRILSPPPCGIIWLLLSADMCVNKFLPLPDSLQQFYAAHLNLTSDDSYSEVSYGSWKQSPEKEDKTDPTECVSHKLSGASLTHEEEGRPKLRPILGAGAGKRRQEQTTVSQDSFETWNAQSKSNLTKRYDLNSWRQEEEKKEEPLYDPTVLPPTNIQNTNIQTNIPTNVPQNFDYPPPRYNQNYQENFNNYLQQGDGAYIQNQYNYQEYYPEPESERNDQTFVPDQPEKTERVNNEVQKTSATRKPIENWRKEKSDLNIKEDSNKKIWTRQRSRDNLSEEEKERHSVSRNIRDSRPVNTMNRRSSGDVSDSGLSGKNLEKSGISGKTPPRKHVSDVPRSHKYWDHDDRCDKDYNS